jgi:2,4-dienoyl-CoA reductase-like NADH-dependent reductase (Old Yellow Enzyme family)
MVHLGARAVGGTGLVMAEATGVNPKGRISVGCMGLWNDAQVDALRPITAFISSQGSVPAVQLAHAGRKSSQSRTWEGPVHIEDHQGGWATVAPSPESFSDQYMVPHELTKEEIAGITQDFVDASMRALDAGYEVLELHFAHGYLASTFMSPFSNHRTDEYGGSLENRCRFAVETVEAVRKAIPDSVPLMARISASEFVEGGWDLEQSIQLSKWLKDAGVDLIDTSGGGISAQQVLDPVPNYQVPFASAIREQAEMMTGAVGLITEAEQAEAILEAGDADIIFLGRELMRNPYWALYAESKLDGESTWPKQYKGASFEGKYTGPAS